MTLPNVALNAPPIEARELSGELPLRVLLVGAGAVSQIFYLPLLLNELDGLRLVGIVDPIMGSLKGVRSDVERYESGFEVVLNRPDVMAGVDVVIVALPHHLHARCVVMALEMGKHVFCEKPLAMNSTQVTEIELAARRTGKVVAVCQPRRNFPAAMAIKQLLAGDRLGPVKSIAWHEGHPYQWPAASLAQIEAKFGGSELFDIGAHVFDLLGWWIGAMEVTKYIDDSAGGTAAEYLVTLVGPQNVEIEVELSRLRQLSNKVVIQCDSGSITWKLDDHAQVLIDSPSKLGLGPFLLSPTSNDDVTSTLEAVRSELRSFARAVLVGSNPNAAPMDAMVGARIFDQVAALAASKWGATESVAKTPAFVVTGASGFIGCAVVKRLLDGGHETLALVHNPRNAVRLARLGARMTVVDITQASSLEDLIPRDSVVIHCAVSQASPWDTIVDGTINVLRAAKIAGAKRVVVLSSMLSMGSPPRAGIVTEDWKLQPADMDYARAKAEMERKATRFASEQGLELVILRPTCVFGPFGSDFGSNQVEAMIRDRFFLVNAGSGVANLIYVENLVDAIMIAATKPGISGRSYILNEEEFELSWADYFTALGSAALGRVADLPSLSDSDIRAVNLQWKRRNGFPHVFRDAIRSHPASLRFLSRSALFSAWLRLKTAFARSKRIPASTPGLACPPEAGTDAKAALVATMLDEPRVPVDESFSQFFSSRAVYSSRRAREDLGWAPAASRRDAMRTLAEWAGRAYAHRG